MDAYLLLASVAVIPVIVSVLLHLMIKHGKMQALNYKTRQIIIGLIFGVIAVLGTHFGIPYLGTVINARDAAPLCAGLIFGAPAGIIAGLIGGIERWFAVYWGVGLYTRTACTVSTMLTGILAAWVRKNVFEDKMPDAAKAFLIGVVAEVNHMLMIFMTNISDVKRAFSYVRECTIPMVLANALATMAAVLIISRLNKREEEGRSILPTISSIFQRNLTFVILLAYLTTGISVFILQNRISVENTSDMLVRSLDDVFDDVFDQTNESLLQAARTINVALENDPDADLKQMATWYGVAEINIYNSSGIITASSTDGNVGFNIASGKEQSDILQQLLIRSGDDEAVTHFSVSDIDPTHKLKYAGIRRDSGFVTAGYDSSQVSSLIRKLTRKTVSNRHIGETGCMLLVDPEGNILAATADSVFSSDETENYFKIDDSRKPDTLYETTFAGTKYYYMFTNTENNLVVALITKAEADTFMVLSVYLHFFTQTVIYGALFAAVFIIIKSLIVKNIDKVNDSLALITDGNLDTKVDVRTTQELCSLSDDINETVDTLKQYIAEANARIDTELKYAKEIQASALPSVFPERDEFDVYALMKPAKEVGGDFYDFYFLSMHRIVFLVADVSGKGIPASLFMMRAKTLLKTYAENRIAVGDIFTNVNYQLCEGNDTNMFVTAWMGILNLQTGELHYANAGHNRPLLRRKNGTYEYLKDRPGFVLAGMEGIVYEEHVTHLEPGDELFLYTDGVVEATNKDNELYGDERLRNVINANPADNARTLCETVLHDVRKFHEDAPQYDDITELSLQFREYSKD